jgi:hypothetical protein
VDTLFVFCFLQRNSNAQVERADRSTTQHSSTQQSTDKTPRLTCVFLSLFLFLFLLLFLFLFLLLLCCCPWLWLLRLRLWWW